MKTLIVVCSYHHHNTRKVAEAIAKTLRAEVVSPGEVDPAAVRDYDLVGFGSGIYSAKHHPKLLELAGKLPSKEGGKAFLFSTDGVPRFAIKDKEWLRRKMFADHTALQNGLEDKGYEIVGHFNCAGFNTNSFLKFFGGFNKGRPNAEDLQSAAAFAHSLKTLDTAINRKVTKT